MYEKAYHGAAGPHGHPPQTATQWTVQARSGPVEKPDSQLLGVKVSEDERVNTARYVVTELSTELYRELLEGLMLR
jgi:hypothetical protein